MNHTVHLRQLEAWLQEELGARHALADMLEAQGQALLEGDIDRVEACTFAVQESAQAAASRGLRRSALMDALAESFGVASGSLTVGSICERLGQEAERAGKLRAELLEMTRAELEQVKRNAALARAQGQATTEILKIVLGSDDGSDPTERSGGLVNARA